MLCSAGASGIKFGSTQALFDMESSEKTAEEAKRYAKQDYTAIKFSWELDRKHLAVINAQKDEKSLGSFVKRVVQTETQLETVAEVSQHSERVWKKLKINIKEGAPL
jgi:hypothetical protein